MTATLFTSPDMQLDHRADMLRGIAAKWDATIFAFDRGHNPDCPLEGTFGRGHCLNVIIDALTRHAAEYADPLLSYSDIRAWMEQLRDAVNALSRYETGEGWDGDADPDMSVYTDETVLNVLNGDIDWALWPLLFGQSTLNVCFRCTRGSKPAQRWNTRVPGQPNCTGCAS